MDVVKITAQMKSYPWGGFDFIQDLVGQPKKDGEAIGELWMGVHPNGPSRVPSSDNLLLSEFLSKNKNFLGKHEAFPFLLKVMAIEKPLSIQCHPNRAQAKKGYAGEEEKRKSVPQALWNYADSNPKAEILYALSSCTAMCGFREVKEIETNLKRLLPDSFDKILGNCIRQGNPIKSYFEQLYRLDKPELKALIAEYAKNLAKESTEERDPFLTARQIALEAVAEFPSDPGVFAPYLLNIVELQEGEAIYLEPQIVHAYVRGNGIELMNNSDNILRAGLTDKHMDVEELMRVMVAKPQPVEKVESFSDEGGLHFITENPDFDLSVFTEGTFTIDGGSLSLLLCTDGSAKVSKGDQEMQFGRGECLLVGTSEKDYQVETEGTVFCAYAPEII
jgi:mannose-6-phosphate isomerase